MIRCLIRTITLYAFFAAASLPAAAETRIALVIGNGAYESQPLDNPPNDAALITDTLQQVGFQVVSEINADGRTMKRAVRKFGRLLSEAGEDAVGFVFYAGHGIQAKGINYMIPVDAVIEDELDVELEGFPASTLLTSLEKAGNRLNIVVMDACRNNPYKAATRSSGSGLARMDAPSGTLIAYSTAPGKVAADGTGRNSPYTRALARAITVPGAPVEEVFKSVRVAVMDRTNQAQVPWESSSLTGSFFFVDRAPEPVATPEPAAPAQPDNTIELTFWNSIKDGTDKGLFESYLAQFPQGVFAGLAKAKIAALQKQNDAAANRSETAFFQAIQNSEKKADFEAYLSQYPDGTFASLAKARIAAIDERQQQQLATAATASRAPAADPDADFWAQVKNANTTAELQAYLDNFPNGKYAAIAEAKIKGIEERRQLATLTPAASGVRTFTGRMVGYGGGNAYTKQFCGSDKSWPMELKISGDRVTGMVKSFRDVTLQGKMSGPSNFSGRAFLGTSSAYRFKGQLTGSGIEVDFGNTTEYCTAKFEGQEQVASLTPAVDDRADGKWKVVWQVKGGENARAAFCQEGEVAEQIVTVSGGAFETDLRSNRDKGGYMAGQFLDGGKLILRFYGHNWNRKNARIQLQAKDGQASKTLQGRKCGPHVFTLTRVVR